MYRLLPLIPILFLLSACLLIHAQDSEPIPSADLPGPSGVQITTGLDRPHDLQNPGPYIRVSWDEPPVTDVVLPEKAEALIAHVGIDIQDGDGRSLNIPKHVLSWSVLWVSPGSIADKLKEQGCTVTERHVRLTDDCLDRFHYWHWGEVRFPQGFLTPGQRYEIRVLFKYRYDWKDGVTVTAEEAEGFDEHKHFSPLRHVTMPRPQPDPTATAPSCPVSPTAGPCPACPACPTPAAKPTPGPRPSIRPEDVPEIREVWWFNNVMKQWQVYIRGAEEQGLSRLWKGQVFYVLVSEDVEVGGLELTCRNGSCWNSVAWGFE